MGSSPVGNATISPEVDFYKRDKLRTKTSKFFKNLIQAEIK